MPSRIQKPGAMMLPSSVLTYFATRWLHHNRGLRSVRAFKQGMAPIVIGLLREKVQQLAPFPEKLRILMEHLILSHHGRFEFGSPKLPMTSEALVFSALDDLEAKMQNMRAEFQKAIEGGKAPDEVTDFSRSLERAMLNSKAYLEGQS